VMPSHKMLGGYKAGLRQVRLGPGKSGRTIDTLTSPAWSTIASRKWY